MKKAIFSAVFASVSVLTFAVPAYAQTVPVDQASITQQIDLLNQIIALLQEIQVLQAQIASQTASIAQNTAPTPSTTPVQGNSTQGVSSPVQGSTAPSTPTFEVYQVANEGFGDNSPRDLYYAGSLAIDPSQIVVKKSGQLVDETFTVKTSQERNDSCFQGSSGKVCHAFIYRLNLSAPLPNDNDYSVTFVSTDGQTATHALDFIN